MKEKLEERDNIPKIIEKIKEVNGKVAFFPFGRLTRTIISEMKVKSPELLSKIIGCFDMSKEVTPEEGINSYHISEMDKLKDNIGLLVIASSTFYDHQVKEIKELTKYDRKILKTSSFDISLPPEMSNVEVLNHIKEVYKLMSDEKSRAVYMVAWLSRVLNDEELTFLFESEESFSVDKEPIEYKGHKIKGIDKTCKRELFAELYKTKPVSPEEGDVVFDIGAYKGDTAIFFANEVGSKGKVYAFEPIKGNFRALIENVEANKLDTVVLPVNKGVSDKPGVLKATSLEDGAPWSYLSGNKGTDVEVTTVDEFVKTNKIDKLNLIKMDVEGGEEEVILGAKKTIAKLKPKLAIAAYHKTTDLIKIPMLINKIYNYKVYIRSKIEGPFGFTIYCK